MRKWFFLCFDLIIVALSPFMALAILNNFQLSWSDARNHLVYALIGLGVAVVVFMIAETHKGVWRYTSLHDFMRILAAVTIIILFSMFVLFTLERLVNLPRSVPLIQWGVIVAVMSCLRLATRLIYKQGSSRRVSLANQKKEQVLVVGLTNVAELYSRCVRDLASGSISIVGVLDESAELKGRRLHHHKVLGSPVDLPQILTQLNVHGVEVHRVVVTMPFKELSKVSQEMLLRFERSGPLTLDLFEERLGFRPGEDGKSLSASNESRESRESGETAKAFDPAKQADVPQTRMGYAFVKRAMDITGALVLLVVALPVLPLICLLVAIDVGLPLTFWQQRPGKNCRPFKLFKYRTMATGHDLNGKRIPDEERLSSFGRFLRRSRLDELPQLYNILIGEMSFVGPRPLLPKDQPEDFTLRLSMRPGLTGWAQVNGGKLVTMEDKMVMDSWYVRHASFRLDMLIIFFTIQMVVRGERLNADAIRSAYKDQRRVGNGEKHLGVQS